MDIYQAFRREFERLVKEGAVRAFSGSSAEGSKMQQMQGGMGADSYEPMFGPKGQGMSISGSFKPTMVNGYSPAGGTFAGRFL